MHLLYQGDILQSVMKKKNAFFFIYHQNSLKKREREREQKTDLAVGFILFFEKDQGLLYSQGWPQTQHSPASASRYWDPGANRKYLNLHLFFPFFSIFFLFLGLYFSYISPFSFLLKIHCTTWTNLFLPFKSSVWSQPP